MKTQLWRGAIVVLALGILLCAWQTIDAIKAFASAATLTEAVTAEGQRGFALDSLPDAFASVAGPGRAVVFVYAPECGACNDNMWNWIDAVRGAQSGAVRFYAVGPKRSPASRGYWRGMEGRVEVIESDEKTVFDRFRVTVTPATLLVSDGVVKRTYLGPLTPAARRTVLRFVEGPAQDPPAGG